MDFKKKFLKYMNKFGIYIIIFLNTITVSKIILFYQYKKAVPDLNNQIIFLESKINSLYQTINNGLEKEQNQMIELEKQLTKTSNSVFSSNKFSQPQNFFSKNFN
ncbi:MAG: hypothetical protein Q8875_02225 [Pigeon pea little leaf phytoplasma]|uniref:Sequence-variable mosaic (SVM) signal sequence domain-containing protein n=1 Tax=Candidatus Phytoplasma fabacearum TaxID=2982628 RepID=A0ABU8ZU09_9MOLU|nr:hypothetical protein [Pigeon pea little leaf phytoplasma]